MSRISAGALAALLVLASCSSSSDSPQAQVDGAGADVADIRADSNRDGVIRFDDDSDAQKMA